MSRLPLHVLTGFLGSGKTTLLNRLLRDPAMADSAVLINEIGDVAIDHHLVDRVQSEDGVETIVLAGGCTCCVVRGDMVAALKALHARRAEGRVPPFARVVLETTGLADPAPILFTLAADPVLRHRFERGLVVTAVDAVHGADQMRRFPEARRQVALADRIVVTKRDIADAATLQARLAALNPAADLAGPADDLLAAHAAFVADPLARLGRAGPFLPALPVPAEAEHTADIAAVVLTRATPIDWAAFGVWLSLLLHAHGERILRLKALLDVEGWPAPVALHGVHHLVHPPQHLERWPAGIAGSRIVLIGERLDGAAMQSSLDRFLAG
ncbi:CobW family GTP-binding protein [Desertibaculum subflavum]|uniref:CobW family GTP-binding protein n=1 Tax=Desertibaculum subflavum TaxID=2268458 RepID=UPI000E673C5F